MQVVDNAVVVGHSFGDNDVYVFCNAETGHEFSVINPKGLVLELGQEGILSMTGTSVCQLMSFETAEVEAFVE